MKKLKEYIEKKKIDKKFKNLGEGRILSEQTTSVKNVSSITQVFNFVYIVCKFLLIIFRQQMLELALLKL